LTKEQRVQSVCLGLFSLALDWWSLGVFAAGKKMGIKVIAQGLLVDAAQSLVFGYSGKFVMEKLTSSGFTPLQAFVINLFGTMLLVGMMKRLMKPSYKSFDKEQFDNYIKEIEEITGRKLTKNQIEELQNALKNNEYSKLPKVDADELRAKFDNNREKLILQWEKETGQKWPTYIENVISTKTGKVIKKAEKLFDAHHIIEISYGGDNAWWNLFPAKYPIEHQGGIHGAGSIAREIFR